MLEQPLVWVFALIVGGLILVWGGYQVYKLVSFSNEIQANDFVTTLKSDIESYYYLEEGSSKVITIILPSGIEHICFTDEGDYDFPEFLSQGEQFLIKNREENVFMFPSDKIDQGAFFIQHITTDSNPLCLENKDKLILTTLEENVKLEKM